MYNVCTIMYTHIRSRASDWNCCVKRLFAQQSTSLIVHIMSRLRCTCHVPHRNFGSLDLDVSRLRVMVVGCRADVRSCFGGALIATPVGPVVFSAIDVKDVLLVDRVLAAPFSSNELDCRHVEYGCKNVLGYLLMSSEPFYMGIIGER